VVNGVVLEAVILVNIVDVDVVLVDVFVELGKTLGRRKT
jgi:hypothetical protein